MGGGAGRVLCYRNEAAVVIMGTIAAGGNGKKSCKYTTSDKQAGWPELQ